MKVYAYPATYSKDVSSLPVVKTVGGLFALPIEFGLHVDNELVNMFIIASRKGAQWIVFDDKILKDEMRWVDLL